MCGLWVRLRMVVRRGTLVRSQVRPSERHAGTKAGNPLADVEAAIPCLPRRVPISPQPACRSRIQDINATTVWAQNRLCCPFEACEARHEGREATASGLRLGVSFTERNTAALTQGACVRVPSRNATALTRARDHRCGRAEITRLLPLGGGRSQRCRTCPESETVSR